MKRAFAVNRIFMPIVLAIIMLIALSSPYPDAYARGERIMVILSRDGGPYSDVMEGFKNHLKKEGIAAELDSYNLEGDKAKALNILQNIREKEPTLIYTLGSLATDTVIDAIHDVPIISSMVFESDKIISAGNASGVTLEIPIKTRLKLLRNLVPEARTVGVIYNPRQNRGLIDEAEKIAEDMNLKLYRQEISSLQELPASLNNLSRNADVFLGINDSTVFSAKTAKNILLFSLRNKIPFIGLSSAWVKAGALYSLDRDYRSIGQQSGEMAVKVLRGAPIDSIHLEAPKKQVYFLNLKTAEHMKIDFSKETVNNALNVY